MVVPKYTPGLPAGKILLLSVLFLSLIQIVQFNTYNLEGRQRQFFFGSLIAVDTTRPVDVASVAAEVRRLHASQTGHAAMPFSLC